MANQHRTLKQLICIIFCVQIGYPYCAIKLALPLKSGSKLLDPECLRKLMKYNGVSPFVKHNKSVLGINGSDTYRHNPTG